MSGMKVCRQEPAQAQVSESILREACQQAQVSLINRTEQGREIFPKCKSGPLCPHSLYQPYSLYQHPWFSSRRLEDGCVPGKGHQQLLAPMTALDTESLTSIPRTCWANVPREELRPSCVLSLEEDSR